MSVCSLFAIVKFPNDECTGSTGDSGTCLSRAECLGRGGAISGDSPSLVMIMMICVRNMCIWLWVLLPCVSGHLWGHIASQLHLLQVLSTIVRIIVKMKPP